MDDPGIRISVPLAGHDRSFVEQAVASGGFNDAAEYVQSLIRQERHNRIGAEADELEAEIRKGLASGPPVEMTPADWERIRSETVARLARRDRR